MESQTRKFRSFLSLFFRRELGCLLSTLEIVVVVGFGSTGLSAVRELPTFPFLSSSPFSLLLFTFRLQSRFLNSNSFSLHSTTLNMSSSNSTAPPSALGECVVCGKESTTCCSSCAKGGVDWMYFCSQEHQKLVSTPFLINLRRFS